MKKCLFFTFCGLLSLCYEGFLPPVEGVILNTSAGLIEGREFVLPDESSGQMFLGVRYAEAPIGDRRFKHPIPAKRWHGVYDATQFGPACYQPNMSDIWVISHQKNDYPKERDHHQAEERTTNGPWYLIQDYMRDISEDCLSLNIYIPKMKQFAKIVRIKQTTRKSQWMRETPSNRISPPLLRNRKTSDSLPTNGENDSVWAKENEYREETVWTVAEDDKLPVMVYIHGGSYFGNAGELYPGEKLASSGMIVVTLNYRLGAFGFLSTGDSAARGNWGLLDQMTALKWVKHHIASFGGDPQKVLLAGNSAGASSVVLQLMSPRTEGLFSRVAVMSGSSLAPWAVQENPLKFAKILARTLNCNTHDNHELVRCLRTAPAKDIMEKVAPYLSDVLWVSFAATVESEWSSRAFLPFHPSVVFKNRNLNRRLPVLYTSTKDEVTIWWRSEPDSLKVSQIEGWIANIMKTIYGSLNLSSANMAAITLSVTAEYLYSLGYKPSKERPKEPAWDSFQLSNSIFGDNSPKRSDDCTAPVNVTARLISDLGLLIPGLREANYLSQITKVYMGRFSFVSPDDIKLKQQPWIGAYHEHELQYLFGLPFWDLENTLQNPVNKNYSLTIMNMFRQFADTGVPKLPGSSPVWPEYSRPGDGVVDINKDIGVIYNHLMDKLAFWTKFIPLLTKWEIIDVEKRVTSSSGTSHYVSHFCIVTTLSCSLYVRRASSVR